MSPSHALPLIAPAPQQKALIKQPELRSGCYCRRCAFDPLWHSGHWGRVPTRTSTGVRPKSPSSAFPVLGFVLVLVVELFTRRPWLLCLFLAGARWRCAFPFFPRARCLFLTGAWWRCAVLFLPRALACLASASHCVSSGALMPLATASSRISGGAFVFVVVLLCSYSSFQLG